MFAHTELVPPVVPAIVTVSEPVFDAEVPSISVVVVSEPLSEAEVQLSILTDDDLSLENVGELLRSVTEAILDQLDKEDQA